MNMNENKAGFRNEKKLNEPVAIFKYPNMKSYKNQKRLSFNRAKDKIDRKSKV